MEIIDLLLKDRLNVAVFLYLGVTGYRIALDTYC